MKLLYVIWKEMEGSMLNIKENQELNVTNILSFRGKIKQSELEGIGKEMESYIYNSGARKSGTPITATYGVEGNTIDMEILMPIDRGIASTDRFVFKNQIKIVNAVKALYKGHPMGLQKACNQLNEYIMQHGLQPITVGYNVTKEMDMLNLDNTQIDVFVGISPNIL